jgi:hypothetical protein
MIHQGYKSVMRHFPFPISHFPFLHFSLKGAQVPKLPILLRPGHTAMDLKDLGIRKRDFFKIQQFD